MTDGRSDRWVKFHVKALENPIFTSMQPSVCKVFMICMAEANFKDRTWWDGSREVIIPRGSFPTSTLALSLKYRLSRQEIRTAFVRLADINFLTTKSTNKYTVVTITNYDTYQGGDDNAQPASQPVPNQCPTNAQPAPNQCLTTLLEVLDPVDNTQHTSPVKTPTKKRVKRLAIEWDSPEQEEWFKEWYALYPKKDIGDAEKAFQEFVKTREVCDLAIEAIRQRLGGLSNSAPNFYPGPGVWLRKRPWRDLGQTAMLPLYSGPDPRMIL